MFSRRSGPQGHRLEPFDAIWHLLNFFAPALGVGALASGLAKLFWWSALQRVGWLPLFGWASAAGAIVLLLGLLVTGRDGRMATFVAMVLAIAVALWIVGFARRGG